MNRVARLTDLLTHALQPTQLTIVDESHKHIGHAGAKSGGGHFSVTIASRLFAGKTRVQCHQLVYQAAEPMMNGEIHALAIQIVSKA